jgi:hypothetical protein
MVRKNQDMKQASLKLKTSIQNVNIMNNNIEIERIILNTILSIFGALALIYILILGNTVFNIIQRRTLEKEALTLSNEVGNLELSYLSVSNSVDLALSSSMGFKEAKATFAIRKSLGSIKLANNEI